MYDTPAFNGSSHIVMKTLKAYNKLSIEIEFKTHKNDGLLLYNQQNLDGTGDFVSLALVNGLVFNDVQIFYPVICPVVQ